MYISAIQPPSTNSWSILTKVFMNNIRIIYENNIQICQKIDSPLLGFEPGTTPVA